MSPAGLRKGNSFLSNEICVGISLNVTVSCVRLSKSQCLGFKEVNSPAAPLHQGQLLREEEESPDDMSRALLMMII